MTLHDLYLLWPPMALVGTGLLVIGLDLLLRDKRSLPVVALAGLGVALAGGLTLWGTVQDAGPQVGIFGTLRVDSFSLFFTFLFIAATALVVLASQPVVHQMGRWHGEYYALVLFASSGMMLLASAAEFITLYIALELTALPVAALAAFSPDRRSREAGVKFLVLSAFSSALLLYGMVLVYAFTGSTRLDAIAAAVVATPLDTGVPLGSWALLGGAVLMAAGFGFKISSVPFQMWVPDVYEGAPTPITAYLSVASKAAGFAALLRVFSTVFGAAPLQEQWALLFAGLAAASMTVGNLVAMLQNNVKRLLAYSTIAHAGYILVGVAAVSARAPEQASTGPAGVLFYLAGYTLTNLAVFFGVIAITTKVGGETIDDLAGLWRRSPWVALALTFSLVSLLGIPPTIGFWAKLYIFGAAVQTGLAWLAVVGVVNSVLSAYYYLRVVRAMFLVPPKEATPLPTSPSVGAALAVSAAAVLFYGILPFPLLRLAEIAARVGGI
ncbi:MAG: NADH-quinone oxidoreductase subunit N [Dehalococcoidia bacterium]|nr:NADH-quinone oxidoreductase subunit N [Dehalococcoidia bacterium]MDW8119239.1 NADH-quinone oxidoreductase subunit N [Chloroflexota bacterium]